MILYEFIRDELVSNCYAVDLRVDEAYIGYGDVCKYLGSRFHLPRHLQSKVIGELNRLGLIDCVNKQTVLIKLA